MWCLTDVISMVAGGRIASGRIARCRVAKFRVAFFVPTVKIGWTNFLNRDYWRQRMRADGVLDDGL